MRKRNNQISHRVEYLGIKLSTHSQIQEVVKQELSKAILINKLLLTNIKTRIYKTVLGVYSAETWPSTKIIQRPLETIVMKILVKKNKRQNTKRQRMA